MLACLVVPAAETPDSFAWQCPPGWAPVTVRGHRLIGVILARYHGDLDYAEVAAAQVVMRGLRIAVSVGAIWVDDDQAERGGRELWAIPKQRAGIIYRVDGARRTAYAGAPGPIVRVAGALAGPGLLPIDVPFLTAQTRAGVGVFGRHRVRARIGPFRGRWSYPSSGPLSWLESQRPIATCALRRLDLSFGTDPSADGMPADT